MFPLPLVLLPIELLPLHIFEPRYRQMLADVSEGNKMFGIIYHESEDATSQPVIGSIGCVAEVREAQELPDGRSNIVVNGIARFRLLEYVDFEQPYLVGKVEFFEDEDEDAEKRLKAADEVFALFERIAKAAFKMSGSRGRFPEIERVEPEPMSFLVTAAFNLDNERKYKLLEMTSTTKRLRALKKILVQAVDQMEENAEIYELSRSNGHSTKRVDL